jgi:hypothetical protein
MEGKPVISRRASINIISIVNTDLPVWLWPLFLSVPQIRVFVVASRVSCGLV